MNRALTSERAWQDSHLPLNKANYALLTLALVAAGYEATRYAILEPLCATERVMVEKRKADWTQLYINALALGIDLDTLPNISECELVSADDAALSGTFASLTTALTGANNDLVITADRRGIDGNLLAVQYVDPGANNAVLAVTLVGTLIRVALATGAGGAITSTATLILAAINANASVAALVTATLAASNSGAGIVTAMAATNLSGGTN